MDAIRIDNLHKTYKPAWPWQAPTTALTGLSLTVGQGEIYGFLGPNGSGKTTTMKILIGLMRQTSGEAEVLGNPAGDVEVRRRIGFLPEGPYFYEYLTAEEFLRFYGRLAGLSGADLERRVTELLELMGLSDARTRQLRKFSKGMLQRVGLAQAIIHDPELIILDEPMSGLDPTGRKQVRDVILSLKEKGKTVFFSTHIIPDVEMICDRVGILRKGRLLAAGRVDELVNQPHSVEVVCEGLDIEGLADAHRGAITRVLRQGKRWLLILSGPERLEEVLSAIRSKRGTLISVTPQKGSLEELFVDRPTER